MKHKVYSIFDKAAGFYGKPFYLVNDQVCERAIRDLLSDPNSEVALHPEDFTVFVMGEYDDVLGSFVLPEPVVLFRCHELKARILATRPANQPDSPLTVGESLSEIEKEG